MPKVFAISDIEEICSLFSTPICIKEVKSQRFVWVNEAAARLGGIAPAELQGCTIRDFWPQQAAVALTRDLRCVRAGEPVEHIDSFVAFDGTQYWVRVRTRPCGSGMVLIETEDITAAVQLAALRLLTGIRPGEPPIDDQVNPALVGLLIAGCSLADITAALDMSPDRVIAQIAQLAGARLR